VPPVSGRRPLADVKTVSGSRDDLDFRVSTVRTGTRLSLVCIAAFAPYLLVTWERPDRTLLLILLLACVPATLAIAALPLRRIVASRWREPFFLAWSGMLVVNCVVGAVLDGGVDSPVVWALVLPLSFAALSYPLSSTIAVGVMVVVGYDVVALTGPRQEIADTLFVSLILVLVTWMCAWQARNHQVGRRALAEDSRTDALTGCLNRRGFDERLAGELSRARRDGSCLGLVLIDLDRFKLVNDTLGHAAGDDLLRRVARAVCEQLRPADALGRLGGDEFAVLVPGAGELATELIASRIQEALDGHAPASLGTASHPVHGDDAIALEERADAALYAAKAARREAGPRAAASPA
jgi:diguanylate cyclase (GGDEF)-like protein